MRKSVILIIPYIGHDTIYRDTTLGIQNPLEHGLMWLMDIHVIVDNTLRLIHGYVLHLYRLHKARASL